MQSAARVLAALSFSGAIGGFMQEKYSVMELHQGVEYPLLRDCSKADAERLAAYVQARFGIPCHVIPPQKDHQG